jgi:hypothetical protein
MMLFEVVIRLYSAVADGSRSYASASGKASMILCALSSKLFL